MTGASQEPTAMVGQPPLPLLPAGAHLIGAAAGLSEDEGGGVVFIWGNAAFAWDASDDGARRFAAVQLVVTKTARPSEVARAFAVGTTTLWRWQCDFAQSGLSGLVEHKKGPKAQRKVTEQMATQIKELRHQGQSLQAIARAVGLSTYPVRQVLGLVGPDRDHGSEPVGGEGPGAPGEPIPDDEARALEPAVHQTGGRDTDDDVEGPIEPATGDLTAPRDQAASTGLTPLALPTTRAAERTIARFGLLTEAEPVFTEGTGLPRLGSLLILPALEATGLIDAARDVYSKLADGFYGLTSSILTMVFLAVAREPRAEGATRIAPHDLGRLLGLDRAPEVKTIRRKLAELAGRAAGSTLVAALAARHAHNDPDVMGYLYVDGHVRVYSGGRDLQKAHVTRARIAAPATLETWVCDQRGDPVFVVTSALSASLVSEIRRLLPELKALAGGRTMTVVFDRGGWSPDLFAEMTAAGVDFLTYRKGKRTRKELAGTFRTEVFVEDEVEHRYDLADRGIRLKLSKKIDGKKTFRCRQVTRRRQDGRQTQIVTSRTDPVAGEIAHRMFARWRQENYFRYGREHFALDALDSYACVADDPERSVPNPARKVAQARLRKARGELSRAEAAVGIAASTNEESKRRTMRGFKIANAELTAAVEDARAHVAHLEETVRATPTRAALKDVRQGATVLDEERKLVTHAIRMSTYNAESALARMLAPHFRIDEGRALLREAFNAAGDLEVVNGTLEVRIDPLSAPRRTRALAALCDDLTIAETCYPGTDLVLRFSVKDRPGVS